MVISGLCDVRRVPFMMMKRAVLQGRWYCRVKMEVKMDYE